jgi:hypothetical protein
MTEQAAGMGRGRDREHERAFYGSQYVSMALLFEHYGIQLWMPEVGDRFARRMSPDVPS